MNITREEHKNTELVSEMESRTRPLRPRTQKIQGQGQEQAFRKQTLSKPRTGMVEAKAKNQGHNFYKLWLANFPLFLSAKSFRFSILLRFS